MEIGFHNNRTILIVAEPVPTLVAIRFLVVPYKPVYMLTCVSIIIMSGLNDSNHFKIFM